MMTSSINNLLKDVEDPAKEKFDSLIYSKYTLVNNFSTQEVIEYMKTQILNSEKSVTANIIQFLGTPGAGKTTLAEYLNREIEHSILLTSDDYCIGTREDRRKIINEGGTAVDEKDFPLFKSHLLKLTNLKTGEKISLPEEYEPSTGYALINGLNRIVSGPFSYILIHSNFYLGDKRLANIKPSLTFYIHMNNINRLKVRLVRDLEPGKERGGGDNEIIKQFLDRLEYQDKEFTIPFMQESSYIIETIPEFEKSKIANFKYRIYKRNDS